MVFGLMKLNPGHCEDKNNEQKYAKIVSNQKDTFIPSVALEGQTELGEDGSTFSFTLPALFIISSTTSILLSTVKHNGSVLFISSKGQWILSSHFPHRLYSSSFLVLSPDKTIQGSNFRFPKSHLDFN